MSEPSVDDHVLSIDEELALLSPTPSECCIYKVHDLLRNEKKEAYEPEVVAIGPYHHGKDNLQPMEQHKLRYLKQLLDRRNETSADGYVVAMKQLAETARKFYAEPISLNTDELAKMMLLDSCFIIELFRKHVKRQFVEVNDPIFSLEHIQTSLQHDLMLIENQLPLFILVKFLNMTDSGEDIIDMSFRFFKNIISSDYILKPRNEIIWEFDFKHLLGLVHYYFCHEFHTVVESKEIVPIKDTSLKSATELHEAGIKFKRFEGGNLFDVRFVNGTMEIPTLVVDDTTETFLRNLIAYEQYLPDTSWHHFTAYRKVMDYLVNTSEDVEILSHHGIIDHFLGDHEVVATMLNKLGNNITSSFECYQCYPEVYNDVNEHCRWEWNVWLAILRRKYFNTPWALISFVAAVLLLLLTMVQTVFAILSVV